MRRPIRRWRAWVNRSSRRAPQPRRSRAGWNRPCSRCRPCAPPSSWRKGGLSDSRPRARPAARRTHVARCAAESRVARKESAGRRLAGGAGWHCRRAPPGTAARGRCGLGSAPSKRPCSATIWRRCGSRLWTPSSHRWRGWRAAVSASLKSAAAGGAGDAGTLAAHVQGPQAILSLLACVRTQDTLAGALRQRGSLATGQSLITAAGEWLGRDWLRVNRGGDTHAGVLEREHRLKGLRERCGVADQGVRALEQEIGALRAQVHAAEQHRDATQSQIHSAHREHSELRGRLEALRARFEELALRRTRIEAEQAEVALEVARSQDSLTRARDTLESATQALARLDDARMELESERELQRERAAAARARAQAAQLELRDSLIRLESRRAARASMDSALARMHEQRSQLQDQHQSLLGTLSQGDAPIAEFERRLQDHLASRVEVEAEPEHRAPRARGQRAVTAGSGSAASQCRTAGLGGARIDGAGATGGAGVATAARGAAGTVCRDPLRTQRRARRPGCRGADRALGAAVAGAARRYRETRTGEPGGN